MTAVVLMHVLLILLGVDHGLFIVRRGSNLIMSSTY